MNRNVYLTITDLEEAVRLFLDKIGPCRETIGEEWIPVQESRGRILSKPVFARLSSPNHNGAAMDGIMVKAESTYLATEASPVILERSFLQLRSLYCCPKTEPIHQILGQLIHDTTNQNRYYC